MADLDYEPGDAARPVFLERDGETTRVVVRMLGPYAPVPRWAEGLDLLSVVVVPVWMVAAVVVRWVLRVPKPPRAVFTITPERFTMTLTHVDGTTVGHECPLGSFREARANRYSAGLFLRLDGVMQETFMAELSPEVVTALGLEIERAVAEARRRGNDETAALA